MILKIIASIFTGIGGHYLNRRWDKAILFLCLMVLSWVFIYGVLIFSLQNMPMPPSGDAGMVLENNIKFTSKLFSFGIFILWFASLAVTILDARNNVASNIVRWTKSGIAGAVLTSLISCVFLFWAIGIVFSLPKNQNTNNDNVPNPIQNSSFSSHNFYENIYFGGGPSDSYNLPAPPEGDGQLKGNILFQQKPAEGVHLSIVLNSKYRVKNIITDTEGVFTVNLPAGDWRINSIQCESWENKPREGSYTLYYGGEEKFDGDQYNQHANFQDQGYKAFVSTDSDNIHINLRINPDIQMLWPNSEKESIKATIQDTIRWEEYPGATQYHVKITKIRKEGSTTYFEPITTRTILNANALKLSSLEHIQTKQKEKPEYGVEIFCFAKDGTLMAEVSHIYRGGTFILSDGNILIKDNLRQMLSGSSNPEAVRDKLEKISANKKRTTAVLTLIDNNMIEQAQTLLNIVDSQYSQGQKEVLSGYILALQGECKKSKEMFDEALNIDPTVCIPTKYRAACD